MWNFNSFLLHSLFSTDVDGIHGVPLSKTQLVIANWLAHQRKKRSKKESYASVGNSLHSSFWCLLMDLTSYYNTLFHDKDIFWTPCCTKMKNTQDTERTSHIACSSDKCVKLWPRGDMDTKDRFPRIFWLKSLVLGGLPSTIGSSCPGERAGNNGCLIAKDEKCCWAHETCPKKQGSKHIEL